MKNITDKFAISLSVLCAIHCLAFPLFLVWLPSIASLGIEGESIHIWMLILVVPTSLYALTVGCKKHKNYTFLAVGALGIASMLGALLLEEMVGKTGEQILTLVGAGLISIAHFLNYRKCNSDACEDS